VYSIALYSTVGPDQADNEEQRSPCYLLLACLY